MPTEQAKPGLEVAANPLAAEQKAATVQAQAQLRATQRTYFPQFYLQGSASARGTGLELNGARLGGWNGLAPTTQDYGIGFTVTFPLMDKFSERAQEAQEAATIRASRAQYQLISLATPSAMGLSASDTDRRATCRRKHSGRGLLGSHSTRTSHSALPIGFSSD